MHQKTSMACVTVNKDADTGSPQLFQWNTAASPCQRQWTAHNCGCYNEFNMNTYRVRLVQFLHITILQWKISR